MNNSTDYPFSGSKSTETLATWEVSLGTDTQCLNGVAKCIERLRTLARGSLVGFMYTHYGRVGAIPP